MALTSLTNVKNELEITSTEYDTILNLLISNISQVIETLADRRLEAVSLTEYYDGDNTNVLILREYPVNSITSITVNDDALTTDDYELYDTIGKIVFDSVITEGVRNIVVEYNAGYTTIPDDLEMLARKLVIEAFRMKDNPQHKSERVGAWSVTFAKSLLLENQMYYNILEKYKRVVL